MTPDPITVDPDTSLEDIATLMVNNNIHTLPVLDGGRLVGIIGKEDVLRTIMPAGTRADRGIIRHLFSCFFENQTVYCIQDVPHRGTFFHFVRQNRAVL